MRVLRDEPGALEIADLLIGVLTAALLVLLVMSIQELGTAVGVYESYDQTATPLHSALSKIDEESASSHAIFIPARDVLGQSNSDNHEFDMLQVVPNTANGSTSAQFIAYRWNSAAKILERWTYLHAPGNTPTQTAGFALPATSFSVSYVNASAAPSTLQEAAFLASVNPQDVQLINMGYSGVDAGNREVHLQIGNAMTVETDDLLQGNYAVRVNYVIGTFTPTPGPCPSSMVGSPPNCITPTPCPSGYIGTAPSCTALSPITLNPAALTFADKTQPAQSFTASEASYSGAFTLTSASCVSGSTTIATSSAASSSSAFYVSPANGGSCTFTVKDSYGQSASESITVNVASRPREPVCASAPNGTIIGTDPSNGYDEQSNGVPCTFNVSPTSLTVQVGQSGTVSISESNDQATATVSAGTCSGYASFSPSSIAGAGSANGTMSGSISVHAVNSGNCTFYVNDNNLNLNAQKAVSLTIPVVTLVGINGKSFEYYETCDDTGWPQGNTCSVTGGNPDDPISDGRFTSATNSVGVSLWGDSTCDFGPQADDMVYQLQWYSSPTASTPSAVYNFTHMNASGNAQIGPVSENVLLPRGAGTYDFSLAAAGDSSNTSWSGDQTCTVDYSINVTQLSNGAATNGP